jgi:cytochrome P450
LEESGRNSYDRCDVNVQPCSPPYFDEALGAWVLSRYRDVMAALRDPELWPVASRGEDCGVTRDEVGRLKLRAPVQDALAPRLDALRARMAPLADDLLAGLAAAGGADLLADYALPWCRELALLVVEAPAERCDLLVQLSAEVFAATGSPEDSPLRPCAAAATAELARLLQDGSMPMGEPTFVAISQTTPRLLGSVWSALLDHPGEAARLRTEPALWPGAIEELLRYAGIVRRIWRQARSPVPYEGAAIAAGQKVLLMLANANRDPEQFVEPGRLDVGRRVPAQFALGAGRNSCAGGALVRMAVEISTRALLARYPNMRACGEPQFTVGSGYAFPTGVDIVFTS